MATSGEKRWPPMGNYVATSGEKPMAIDTLAHCRVLRLDAGIAVHHMHVIQFHALAPAVWEWPEPNREVSSSEICPDIRVERKLVFYPAWRRHRAERTTRRARSTALTVSRELECNEKGARSER
jgi:hypothetical protein